MGFLKLRERKLTGVLKLTSRMPIEKRNIKPCSKYREQKTTTETRMTESMGVTTKSLFGSEGHSSSFSMAQMAAKR